VLIAKKLGVSQRTVSKHLKVLFQAGLLTSKRVKQWTFYKRDEVQSQGSSDLVVHMIGERRTGEGEPSSEQA